MEMVLNKKRFVIGFVFALILSGLIFVIASEGYLSGTTGSWMNYNENIPLTEITLYDYQLGGYPGVTPIEIEFCNDVTPDICSGGDPVAAGINVVKPWITNVNAPSGPIYFEIYEKDGTPIRAGSSRLNGIIRDTSIAVAPWSISLIDIANAGIDADSKYEFYYKAITPEGYEKIYDSILNVTILWTGQVTGGDWYNNDLNSIINSVNVDAVDLLAGENSGPGASNLVYMKAYTENADDGTPVIFQILDTTFKEIRAGTKSIVGIVQRDEANGPWRITLEDLETADSNKFYFTENIGGFGINVGKDLEVNVDYSGLMALLTPGWLDFSLKPITSTSFNWNDLANPTPSQSNSVYAYLKGFPSQTYGKNLSIEIWEKDTGLNGDIDDAIRIGSKALTGTIDNNGELKILWKLTQQDIINAETEPYYDFYYKIVLGKNEISYRDDSLHVTINGTQSVNITDAEGVWKDRYLSNQITSFSWVNGAINNVTPYSWNINAPQGTQITFEIYEKDAIGGDDSIRTVAQGNALTATVDSLGIAHPLWTITQADLNAANEQCTINSPCEFYFKIIYSTQSKTFDNVLLDVSVGESTCINIFYCMDYMGETECNQDACGVANSTGLAYGIDCTIFGINCGCAWNATNAPQCNFIYTNSSGAGPTYGGCTYLENSTDNCNDGVLTLSWTGSWTWATGNTYLTQGDCENICGVGLCVQDLSGWHCDPELQSASCTSTSNSNSISCPAKVQLPGFNWLNIIFIVIALIIIYFLIAWRRKVIKKKKRK